MFGRTASGVYIISYPTVAVVLYEKRRQEGATVKEKTVLETYGEKKGRVRPFKIHKRGVNIMCEIADRIRKEGRLECVKRMV